MRLSELVRIYVAKRSGVHWKSLNTIRSNKSTLNQLQLQLPTDPLIEDVDDRLILRAIDRKWSKGDSTYPTIHARIKTFLIWAKARYPIGDVEGITSVNEAIPDLEKQYLTGTEMFLVVKIAREQGDHRNAGAIEFAYWSHRREDEIFSMRRRDVDFTPRNNAPYGVYWFTETKASKGRQMLALLEEEANCLRIWIAHYEDAIGKEIPPMAYLFPSRYGAGRPIKGQQRQTKLRPTEKVGNRTRVFSDAYKAAGVHQPKKGGHAARRGGEEDVYVALREAGVDDPIGVIIERSKQTRETAEAYLNRRAAAERSDRAYALISQRRKEQAGSNQVESQEAHETPQTPSNVVRLFPRGA